LRLVAGTAGALGSGSAGAAGVVTDWMGAGVTGSGLAAALAAAGLVTVGLDDAGLGAMDRLGASPPTGADLAFAGAVCQAGRGAEFFFLA
jgi:hypothetical protein